MVVGINAVDQGLYYSPETRGWKSSGLSSDLDKPDASVRRARAVPARHEAHCIENGTPMIKKLFVTTVLSCACAFSQATVVNGDFTNAGGIAWTVDFKVTNDGTLPLVGNFTVFFDYGSASNLVLVSSPGNWDTLVLQADDGLASAGYLDSLPLDAGNKLSNGQSISGFTVRFDWRAPASPQNFVYSINDDNLAPLETGLTASVPEISSTASMALGITLLGILGAAGRRCASAGSLPA